MSWFRRKKVIANLKPYIFFTQVCSNCEWTPKNYKPMWPLAVDIINGCNKCKPKSAKDAYNAAGPGSYFYVDIKEEQAMKCEKCNISHGLYQWFISGDVHTLCSKCYDKYTITHNGLTIFACDLYCWRCGIEVEAKLTYCVSCAGGKKEELKIIFPEGTKGILICEYCHKKLHGLLTVNDIRYRDLKCTCKREEPKMKEFDLRPFEVKKEEHQKWIAKIGSSVVLAAFTYHALWRRIENPAQFGCDFEKIEISLEISTSQWTFADIQVGWFFKVEGGSVYQKINNTWLQTVVSRIGLDYECVNSKPHYDKITNVYDCPELGKVLMIERVIT